MKTNTLIGISKDNEEVIVDFTNHNFMLLIGETGSGKSIFHNYLYRLLSSDNSPQEIGFIFLDMTRVDFSGWKSKYIINNESRMEDAIKILEDLSLEETTNRHIFIHIEECDMFVNYKERTEKAISVLLEKRKDITIIYSTSSPSERTMSPFMLSLVDIKVACKTSSQRDQDYILGETLAIPSLYGMITAFDNKKIYLKPVDVSDFDSIVNWKLE
jgi:DNA segregation ATPase FtsK/SpoIIIE-like protein